jgi:flavorubredoxin
MKRMFNVEPRPVKDGDVLKVGNRSLRIIDLPWIHWPDSMFLYLEDEGILFTSDAFGAFGALENPLFDDEVDFASYLKQKKEYFSTVVVGHRTMVLRDVDKIKTLGLKIKMLVPAHGIVYRSKIQEFTETMASWCKLQKKRKHQQQGLC